MNIKLPKSIFKDIQELNIKKIHRDFTLAFIIFNVYMYENCLYRYRTPEKTEIKSILGISPNNKAVNYIVKAKGEISKYLFTVTRNYPIKEDKNGKVFVYDLCKQKRDLYLIRNKPNFKIFAPNEDYYNKELFEVDEEVIHFFMSNQELGYKLLYPYVFLKSVSINDKCEFSTKELAYLSGETEEGIAHKINVLERYNCISKPFDINIKKFKININNVSEFSNIEQHRDRMFLAKTSEQFKKDIYDKYGDSHTVLSDYENSTSKILVRHNDCGYEWETNAGAFLHIGINCPYCHLTSNEKIIADWFDNHNIRYDIQYRFDDCKYKLPLPFDFAIFNNKGKLILLIEYDGEQHFKPITFGGKYDVGASERFKETKIRDEIKNKYCKDNNYRLLRIPYYEFDNYEKLIINQFIEIIKN